MRKVTKKEKPNSNASLGKRIEYVRTKKGMTQADLANILFKQREQITMFENDTRQPDVNSLKDIAKSLNVSTDYLLGLTEFESLNFEDKITNKKLGLNDETINSLTLFNSIEKDKHKTKEVNKVHILNMILSNTEFVSEMTSAVSEAFEKVLIEANHSRILNNSNNAELDIKSVSKDLKLAPYDVNNAFVKLFNTLCNQVYRNNNITLVDNLDEEEYE